MKTEMGAFQQSFLTSREVWSEEKAMKQRPSGENFLRKQGGFSTLTTVKLGNRFWWKQRTLYQCAPARPEQILRLSSRWTTFWFWMRLGFRVEESSSMVMMDVGTGLPLAWVVFSHTILPLPTDSPSACLVGGAHHSCLRMAAAGGICDIK